ncbi:hypothetical protein [Actinoplanes friuliensis]|uniref:Uncharacterized protein n=1 Tax=Actinoplanes friuliensis DSM 7358 TaxID=1246995 RepID=U5VYT5_9ACTN|nr:hypothetical protein [Actinoplanes friuliensis]AGZ40831.1 hypothetical protein AFR_12725 [Actinoplanes friuliensis DSM 7358]
MTPYAYSAGKLTRLEGGGSVADIADDGRIGGTSGYRNAGQCSGLQAGGEGPRWEGRQARAVP